MSNYKDHQIIQLENEELRIRLKDLQKQLDATEAKSNQLQSLLAQKEVKRVFHLESDVNYQSGNGYRIVDEKGFTLDTFTCDNDMKAVSFLRKYEKEYKPTQSEPIIAGVRGNSYHSLIELKLRYISILTDELELKDSVSYVAYVDRDCIKHFPSGTTKEEALNEYPAIIDEYFSNKNLSVTKRTILI